MIEVLDPPRLFVISGPSGVGKDTVIACLREQLPTLHYTVTATTRLPRPEEVDGVHYHFVSEAGFDALIEQGELLEWQANFGVRYGTPRQQVAAALAAGSDVLLKIDVKGAARVRETVAGAVSIFIAPGSPEELQTHLAGRVTESPAEIEWRLRDAQRELAARGQYDYQVINRHGELQAAVERLKAIIIAEHCRVNPRRIEV